MVEVHTKFDYQVIMLDVYPKFRYKGLLTDVYPKFGYMVDHGRRIPKIWV